MSDEKLVYSSPLKFSLRQRATLFATSHLITGTYKSLMSTMRVQVEQPEFWDEPVRNKRGVIIAAFHEAVGMGAWQHRNTGFHTLTSYSYDGELMARIVHQFGLKALRGSSSRGGMKALSQLQIAVEQNEPVGITVDGPRGPRRVAKSGVAILAAKTQVPVILNAYAMQRSWRLNSWDRFPIPKPFSRIVCAYGAPIPPPARVSSEEIEKMRVRVEDGLNALHRRIETEMGCDPKMD